MPEVNETNLEQSKSKRELLVERLKAKYPDMNPDDEDGLYDRISGDYDEYEGSISASRQNEQELTQLLASDPRSADFLMNWKKGESPVVLLMRMFGDEFREALEDPMLSDKLSEARNEYISRQTKNEDLQEQAKGNLVEALDNLDKAVAEGGYTEDQADEAFKLFDDIVEDAIVNKVSVETWIMILKAKAYDGAIEEAAHQGEVRGRNTKIDENKKKSTIPANIPPSLGGASKATSSADKADLGVLDRFSSSSGDIWERGSIRRNKR